MDALPGQNVCQDLSQAGDEETYSYDRVVDVLETLYGSKETGQEAVAKLQRVQLTAPTPEGLSKFRDEFLTLAHVSLETLTGRVRRMLIEAILPEPVNLVLVAAPGEDGEFADLAKLFERARHIIHKAQPHCLEWWDRQQTAISKGKRPATFAEAAAAPAKAQRTASGPKPAQQARAANPGLLTVPIKTAEEIKSLADRNLCMGCGSAAHRWKDCHRNNKGGNSVGPN